MSADAVVVGAGPYGLSVAANLLGAGLNVRVFGRPMEMWTNHMPEGMLLKSDGFASSFGALPLTLQRFCAATGRPYKPVGHRTPLADLVAYGQAVCEDYVGTVTDQRVTEIHSQNNGFLVCLQNGEEVFTKRVISATGLMGLQNVPAIEGMPRHRMTHASDHHSLARFDGKRVLVIGGGQSAFETAALLRECGATVEVLSREEPFWFNPDAETVPSLWTRIRRPNFGLGPGWRTWFFSEAPNLFHRLPRKLRLAKAHSTFGPAGSGWLYDRVVGKIPTSVGSIQRAEETAHGVQLDIDGRALEVDHVIAATGYKPDLRKLSYLAPVLPLIDTLADGIPALDKAFQTSLRGLHVVGCLSASSFGPSMRFIYGTNTAAPQIARAIKRDNNRPAVGYRSTAPAYQVAG
jgi:hypothetical protein